MKEKCIGCMGEFDKINGPVHKYIISSPGCWQVYGQVLAREYENFTELKEIHRYTVDTYAVQHPGRDNPQARQSVWSHLFPLFLLFEKNFNSEKAQEGLRKFVDSKIKAEWIEPPDFNGGLNINYLLKADSTDDHKKRVKIWAEAVWKQWYYLHKEKLDKIFYSLI